MNTLHFQCPSCHTSISVGTEYAGKRGKCSTCGAVLTIPAGRNSVPVQPTWAQDKRVAGRSSAPTLGAVVGTLVVVLLVYLLFNNISCSEQPKALKTCVGRWVHDDGSGSYEVSVDGRDSGYWNLRWDVPGQWSRNRLYKVKPQGENTLVGHDDYKKQVVITVISEDIIKITIMSEDIIKINEEYTYKRR